MNAITVYSANSMNCGSASGQFGRFSPNTKIDTVALVQRTQREWYIKLPSGCTAFVGRGGKRETEAAFALIVAAAQSPAGYDSCRWRTDRAAVEADSVADAITRHNQACERDTYRVKFGEPINA